MPHLRKTSSVLFASLALVAILLAGCAPASSSAQGTPCTMNFEATVRQGPDAGTAYTGTLKLTSGANGSLSGVLTQQNGGQVQVAGQANGRAINLIVDLGGGKHLFGVGTLENDFSQCKGAVGGPLVGPQSGDTGDWGYGLGG
jgi:hypothetical protein